MVTHDPVVARLADRRVDLHHGRIASQEIFGMEEEEQFDEILEEIWVVEEHGESAEIGRMEMHGPAALPLSIALEKMSALGLVDVRPHPPEQHQHRPVVNPCHEDMHLRQGTAGAVPTDGHLVVGFTAKGRRRAGDVIRRHRLAERLFTETFHEESEEVIEEQACKFEHILSPEATERICSFLGHPKACPHGAPIPPGPCCGAGAARN